MANQPIIRFIQLAINSSYNERQRPKEHSNRKSEGFFLLHVVGHQNGFAHVDDVDPIPNPQMAMKRLSVITLYLISCI